MKERRTKSVVIAASATTSATIETNGLSLVALEFPAAFTGTAISFKAGKDEASVKAVHNIYTATDVSVTIATATKGKFCPFLPTDFISADFIQIVSNDTEVAERTFIAHLREV